MSAFLQFGLLIWYFISLYLVATDKTLPLQLKITGEIINLLSIGFIATNMMNECTQNTIYYIVAYILLAWYIYFTTQDWNNPGYTPIEKYGYTAIDILTLLYIGSTIVFNYIGNLQQELNVMYDFMKLKGFLFGI